MDAANASAIPESHYLMLQKKYAPPPDIVDVASAGGGSGDDVDDDGGGNGNDLDDDWLNEDLSMEPIDTEEDEWKPYLRNAGGARRFRACTLDTRYSVLQSAAKCRQVTSQLSLAPPRCSR